MIGSPVASLLTEGHRFVTGPRQGDVQEHELSIFTHVSSVITCSPSGAAATEAWELRPSVSSEENQSCLSSTKDLSALGVKLGSITALGYDYHYYPAYRRHGGSMERTSSSVSSESSTRGILLRKTMVGPTMAKRLASRRINKRWNMAYHALIGNSGGQPLEPVDVEGSKLLH